MPRRRRFQRRVGVRRYRRLIVIATEGSKTEPQYFSLFNNQESVIKAYCLRGRHDSAPPKVLKRMKDYIENSGLQSTDQAWLVVDRDNWTEEQLGQLYHWSEQAENYGFALSNPRFEYWLLLHFEDGSGIAGAQDCADRLNRYVPHYKKGIDPRKFPPEAIEAAIGRASQRDNPPCADWPRLVGSTTVYRLVGKILEKGE
ncbi:MAG: RloB family protein [Pseudomonadota bacterium]|nr:RloB family protein [Pseudomonadota bacterium]